jgi:spore germination protein KC
MMFYRKWIGGMLLLLLTSCLVNGCGFKDIEKRQFVVSVGIDPAKESSKKYTISLKFAIPNANKKSAETMIVSQEANTISEAVRAIKSKVEKEIDFSHAKVVVFNQEVWSLRWRKTFCIGFLRRRDFQKIAWLAIGKPSALDVLKLSPKTEHLPSNDLFLKLGREGSESAYTISEFLFDFKKRVTEKGLDPILPIIEASNDRFVINTVGLFRDNKLMLMLKPEDTKKVNYLLNNEQKSALKIEDDNKYFILDTKKVKTKYKIVTSDQRESYIEMKVIVRGIIEEALFPVENEEVPSYEKMAEKVLTQEMTDLLVKLQKANVDPIGFGLRYRARHFERSDWERWQGLYPTIKFKVHTDVQINDTGLIE